MSATAALELSLKQTQALPPINNNTMQRPMISSKSLKRSRSTTRMGLFDNTSFDMSDFVKASKQVEESIAFPEIAWSFDESDAEEDSFDLEPSAKRRCRGLVRSKGSADLSVILGVSSSSSPSSQRFGSSGSLC